MIKQYGILTQKKEFSALELHVENIKAKGFTVVKKAVDDSLLEKLRGKLDEIYLSQEMEFGKENMRAINELNMVRTPFYHDSLFLELVRNKECLTIVRAVLGEEVMLHLQNGIINHPNETHHQSSWHRDLPYQEYTISKPLALSVFYCLDPFKPETGATILLPYSHKQDTLPSLSFVEENQWQLEASPGDAILFDSMVFHKSGYNSSEIIRRGVNNVFTAPLLKQQICLPKLLNGKYAEDEELFSLLGYKYAEADSIVDYRNKRIARLKNEG